MAHLRAEFTVEPFAAGAPGPHVTGAIDAARSAGVEPEVGPFATVVAGDQQAIVAAVERALAAAFAAGATRVVVTVEQD